MKALPNLDFLRAVAVLSVVVEHVLLAYKIFRVGYWTVSWIGLVGVFLFFVHTSLVLMWSLERKPHTLDFYIRRVFRIYPLAIFAVLVTVLFHIPVGGPPSNFQYAAPHSAGELASALLLIPNLYRNYLPIGVMWSLPYEMQMYLVLPAVFFFVRRNFSLWPLLMYWVFVVAVCRGMFADVPHNFFLCIPYFLPGVMAYVGFGRRQPILPAWLLPVALAEVWVFFMLRPGWREANFVCLAVGLGLPFFHQITAAWLVRVSQELAKYSYSIYLVHPFAIVLALHVLHGVAVEIAGMVVLTAVFSVAGYHLLERPMIRLGSRLAARAEARFEQFDAALMQRRPEQLVGLEAVSTDLQAFAQDNIPG